VGDQTSDWRECPSPLLSPLRKGRGEERKEGTSPYFYLD